MTFVSVTRSEIKSRTDQNTGACQSSFEELLYPSAALSPFTGSEENHPRPAVLWTMLKFLKSCRLGCPPLLKVPLCCQSSTKETLNHPYREWTACTASRIKSSSWEESASHRLRAPNLYISLWACWLPRIAYFFFSLSSCYLMHCT